MSELSLDAILEDSASSADQRETKPLIPTNSDANHANSNANQSASDAKCGSEPQTHVEPFVTLSHEQVDSIEIDKERSTSLDSDARCSTSGSQNHPTQLKSQVIAQTKLLIYGPRRALLVRGVP